MRFSQKIRNNLTIRHLQSVRLFCNFKFLIPHRETCLIEGRKTPNRNTKDAQSRLDSLAFATRLGIFPETENDRGGFLLKKKSVFETYFTDKRNTTFTPKIWTMEHHWQPGKCIQMRMGGLRRWHVFRKRTQKGFIVWKLSIFLISSQSNPVRYER